MLLNTALEARILRRAESKCTCLSEWKLKDAQEAELSHPVRVIKVTVLEE